MIRSRDLLIFVGILFILGIGIVCTIALDSKSVFYKGLPDLLQLSDNATTSFEASADVKNISREDTIARLREELAKNDTVITPSASVEEVVSISTDTETDENVSAVTLQRCGGADTTLSYTKTWPLTDVFVIVKDGTRTVVHISPQEQSGVDITATTTQATSTKVVIDTLLTMRAFPVVMGNTSCVDGEAIGVTTEGSLLFNTDAGSYKTLGENELVGYARDGFPIYGTYTGDTDTCGGYLHPAGYRYTLQPERNFILGCYAGTPSTFGGV